MSKFRIGKGQPHKKRQTSEAKTKDGRELKTEEKSFIGGVMKSKSYALHGKKETPKFKAISDRAMASAARGVNYLDKIDQAVKDLGNELTKTTAKLAELNANLDRDSKIGKLLIDDLSHRKVKIEGLMTFLKLTQSDRGSKKFLEWSSGINEKTLDEVSTIGTERMKELDSIIEDLASGKDIDLNNILSKVMSLDSLFRSITFWVNDVKSLDFKKQIETKLKTDGVELSISGIKISSEMLGKVLSSEAGKAIFQKEMQKTDETLNSVIKTFKETKVKLENNIRELQEKKSDASSKSSKAKNSKEVAKKATIAVLVLSIVVAITAAVLLSILTFGVAGIALAAIGAAGVVASATALGVSQKKGQETINASEKEVADLAVAIQQKQDNLDRITNTLKAQIETEAEDFAKNVQDQLNALEEAAALAKESTVLEDMPSKEDIKARVAEMLKNLRGGTTENLESHAYLGLADLAPVDLAETVLPEDPPMNTTSGLDASAPPKE